MIALRGLAWGHRRATGPLDPLARAFRLHRPDVSVEWTVRPLSAFEHQDLASVASVYDLVIFDHPFGGDVVASGALMPLSGTGLPVGVGDAGLWMGPSLASYRVGGAAWGLPLDGATMHAVLRPDLMAGEAAPASWAEALALGRRLAPRGLRLGLAVASPHGVLALASLQANLGMPWETDPDRPFAIDRAGFDAAYEMVREALAFCPPEAMGWNAIDLHDAMALRDDLAFCPCAYGYATYAEADGGAPGARPLAFAPFAGARAPFHAGSAVGGTALGISRGCPHPEAALAFLAFCAGEEAQGSVIPAHHGQPARRSAWDDAQADARLGGYLAAARSSMEGAWVRPRHRGYIPFQRRAGEVVARALAEGAPAAAAWRDVEPLTHEVNP